MVKSMRSPQEAVEQLMEEAPNAAWLRAVVDALDRHLRLRSLERLQTLWGLSDPDTAKIFGVSSQALSRWLRVGVPSKHARALAELSAASDTLDHYAKRAQIPAIVRRSSSQLTNRSLYELACEGRHAEVRAAIGKMFDLHRAQT